MSNKPSIAKKKVSTDFDPGFDLNPLTLDSELKAELKKKGLVARFLNAKEHQKNYGFHRQGWKPYKRDGATGSKDQLFGSDPDGYVRYGDLILGVRPIAINERHKYVLKQKNEANASYEKRKAQEIRQSARKAGVEVKVYEGYDENDPNSD